MLRTNLGRVLVISGLLFSLAQPSRGEVERTFAVVPQLGSVTLVRQWQPLLIELGQQTGVRFRFITAPSVSEFERRLLEGRYDYAYMNAALYLESKKKGIYRGLAQRQKPLRGILVVRQNGPTSLNELAGKSIAFPAPRALGATLLVRSDLRRAGIEHNVAYLGTHESAYRAVASGQFIAAGGVQRSFQTLAENARSALRVLHTTAPAPPHIIAANRRIPGKESEKVGKALRAMKLHRRGQEALARLSFKGLVKLNQQGLKNLAKQKFPARRKTRAIVFHVIPRMNEHNTRQQMQPLAAYLKRRLEVDVNLHTHVTMGDFEKIIYTESQPALINANPVQAIRLAKKGYLIVAQQIPVESPEGMRGIIVVRKDSSINTVSDLAGKRIAFGGNDNAFFATIIPKILLNRSGLDGKYIDVSKPGPISDVIKRLHRGEIEAAGIGTMVLHSKILQDNFNVQGKRIIIQSEPMPGLAWLLSNSIEPALREEIRGLLLAYGMAAPGHTALRAGGVSGLQSANLQTYAKVKQYVNELH
ncbi:MAG: PhnD/SsuA/transferrin family substrate-binding protein [Acidiferrobacterales bacterium]